MCGENSKITLFYVIMVCLMAMLLFSISVLNFENISKLEQEIKTNNEKSVKVGEIQNVLEKLYSKQELKIKNEISKIILNQHVSGDKIISSLKEINRKINTSVVIENKLDNMLEIMERIYDFAAINENTRTTDNYNFYNLVKNQVMDYCEKKINYLMEKCTAYSSNSKLIK